MRIHHVARFLGLTALFVLSGWIFPQPSLLPSDKSVTVHLLYSSDAQGYHEPCG